MINSSEVAGTLHFTCQQERNFTSWGKRRISSLAHFYPLLYRAREYNRLALHRLLAHIVTLGLAELVHRS